MAGLDEDTVDEVLYLARANEAAELASFVSKLSEQTQRAKAELVVAAVDPHSKNTALHYAAANGHNGTVSRAFERVLGGQLTRTQILSSYYSR